jgi:ABC-type glycerol-3-phosphate transport system substrate-binding protein
MAGTVTLWLDWGPDKLAALERILDSYREIHPGARFRVVFVPEEELESRFAGLAETEPGPSLIIASSRVGPEWYEAGLLRSVSEVLPPDQEDAIHPVAWSQVEYGQEIIALPFELQGTVLIRNAELAPYAADTVEAMLEQAESLRAQGLDGASLDLGFERAAPLLRTCKGELESDESVDPILRPAGLCWLRLLNRMASAGSVTFNSLDDEALFQAGKSAWLLADSRLLGALAAELGEENLRVDLWPLYQATGESLAGYAWTENLYFPAATAEEDFEASWSLAIFLLAAENQRLLSEARGVQHIPVLSSVVLEDPLLQGARRGLEIGLPLPDFRPLQDIARELGTAVRLVAGQGGDPELALELSLDEIRKARIPTATPTRTPAPTLTATPSATPPPTPPPG